MNEVRELVTNHQIGRIKHYTTQFIADPGREFYKDKLITAINAFQFLTNMEDEDFEDANFENVAIRQIEDHLYNLYRESVRSEERA